MNYSIYLLKFPNKKVYVGQTKKSVESRFIEHKWDRTKSSIQLKRPIISAMKKYKGLVVCETLESNLTLDEANFLERYYIKYYNSIDINFGYNLCVGGNAGNIMSEAGKKRRAEKMQKHYDNPEYVKKITKHLTSPEHREKVEKGFRSYLEKNPDHYEKLNKNRRPRSQAGSISAAIKMGGKPFYCVETGEVFYLLKDAAKRFGSPCKDSIYKVLKGKRKTYKKLHFKYVEQER